MSRLLIFPHLPSPPGEVRETDRGCSPHPRSVIPDSHAHFSSAKESAMPRKLPPPKPESLEGIRQDGKLLDALGGRTTAPAEGDELSDLLAAWHDEAGA